MAPRNVAAFDSSPKAFDRNCAVGCIFYISLRVPREYPNSQANCPSICIFLYKDNKYSVRQNCGFNSFGIVVEFYSAISIFKSK